MTKAEAEKMTWRDIKRIEELLKKVEYEYRNSPYDRIRLLQVLGYLRKPKLTYKTNMEYINKRRYNGHKRPTKH